MTFDTDWQNGSEVNGPSSRGSQLRFGIFVLKEKSQEEAYPLAEEWAEIQKEFYRYYLIEEKLPEDLSFLSDTSKQIIELYQDQFEWDAEEQTLTLTHLEPLTIRMGLLRKKSTVLGTSITPFMVENNSELSKESGNLY